MLPQRDQTTAEHLRGGSLPARAAVGRRQFALRVVKEESPPGTVPSRRRLRPGLPTPGPHLFHHRQHETYPLRVATLRSLLHSEPRSHSAPLGAAFPGPVPGPVPPALVPRNPVPRPPKVRKQAQSAAAYSNPEALSPAPSHCRAISGGTRALRRAFLLTPPLTVAPAFSCMLVHVSGFRMKSPGQSTESYRFPFSRRIRTQLRFVRKEPRRRAQECVCRVIAFVSH